MTLEGLISSIMRHGVGVAVDLARISFVSSRGMIPNLSVCLSGCGAIGDGIDWSILLIGSGLLAVLRLRDRGFGLGFAIGAGAGALTAPPYNDCDP